MNFLQKIALSYSHKAMQKSLENGFNVQLLKNGQEKKNNPKKSYMLYAHIPFCHTFCPYCSFHKYYYDENLAKQYFESLREEIKQIKLKGFDFTSMYVGGGTTLINEEELAKTLELCKKLFNIKEISCETDPNHIEPEKLKMFKGLIDRLSCGVQSFDDDILKKVARYNKFGSSKELQEKLSKAIGILPVMSLDLIFNFPSQTQEQLLKDLEIAKNLKPQQITTYPLMKSNLTKDNIAKTLGVSFQDNEFKFYNIIVDYFKDYERNNAWSFSLEKSSFNDEYVSSHHEYLGVGSGAFSFLDGELLINAFNLNDYSKLIKEKQNANIAKANFSKKEIIKYIFLTEMFAGKIEIDQLNRTLDCNIKKDLFIELLGLKASKALIQNQNTLQVSEFGRYLFMVLMKDFYTGMDLVRAVFRDDKRIKNKEHINIMHENVDPLSPDSMKF
ncbi:coproporphyrinogen III oxidase family protein [Campylobacter insulaenigrae]|uniref:coproporphyrinogen III oxidase family protein n=1 Tax=Campylobacter insulaenigrae TaxID=260714 RepID=UPI002152B8F2|nr:coproporphyrinogen III oxidase family protein [Campylobacter insulaenigrae]MCR6570532.1 coproporphyrinogen III oxidase family protein [Campylobacter insulaenigrae]MCR6572344.1 coproporphyrinogen III oxidase family protein [Campylobacter insulaenigrae]MCR6579188.1 coproporphyrinogen III oxidase family protein [Campylobacter insulaenigrae]MCR6581707.1 coproporphyrinogen III oxidase family protein [Campylobacter insulaenigrae]MCR6584613.1 coproporphyrinogen III oxidase family protein [Campylob